MGRFFDFSFFEDGNRSMFDANNNYNNFRTDIWPNLSESEKINALQILENETALSEGRRARKIFPDKELSLKSTPNCVYLGEYAPSNSNILKINPDFLDSSKGLNQFQAMETVLHEGRHAYQHDKLSNIDNLKTQEDIDRAKLWDHNMKQGCYYENGVEYRYQPVEADANDFADKKIKELEYFYSNDADYAKYRQNRAYQEMLNENDIMVENAGSVEAFKDKMAENVERKYQQKYGTEKYKANRNNSKIDESPDSAQINSKADNPTVRSQSRVLGEDLRNPNLFNENKAGDYTYSKSDLGKSAYGSLKISDDPQRDPKSQLEAGGADRQKGDDGSHFIAASFGGATGEQNLEANNKDLNRRSFRELERGWRKSLDNGDKVFVNIESYRSNGSERPDAMMGYSITEHPDGSREWDAFSFQNMSTKEQEEIENELDELFYGGDSERQNNNSHYNPEQENEENSSEEENGIAEDNPEQENVENFSEEENGITEESPEQENEKNSSEEENGIAEENPEQENEENSSEEENSNAEENPEQENEEHSSEEENGITEESPEQENEENSFEEENSNAEEDPEQENKENSSEEQDEENEPSEAKEDSDDEEKQNDNAQGEYNNEEEDASYNNGVRDNSGDSEDRTQATNNDEIEGEGASPEKIEGECSTPDNSESSSQESSAGDGCSSGDGESEDNGYDYSYGY